MGGEGFHSNVLGEFNALNNDPRNNGDNDEIKGAKIGGDDGNKKKVVMYMLIEETMC